MPPTGTVTEKPSQLHNAGESPPRAVIPPQLAEELAEIIADALVADYYADQSKTDASRQSSVN